MIHAMIPLQSDFKPCSAPTRWPDVMTSVLFSLPFEALPLEPVRSAKPKSP